MNNKKELEELVTLLTKDLNYTVASSGGYIFSGILIPIRFELFISDDKIGLKYPKSNLSSEKIDAITSLLKSNNVGEFYHRTYGAKNIWSVWDLSVTGMSHDEISKMIQKLTALCL